MIGELLQHWSSNLGQLEDVNDKLRSVFSVQLSTADMACGQHSEVKLGGQHSEVKLKDR